jgi:hypothetical protein
VTVAFVGRASTLDVAAACETLRAGVVAAGQRIVDDPADASLVVNMTEASQPVAHWTRGHVQQFGLTLARVPGAAHAKERATALLSGAYPILLRTLSNAVVAIEDEACALVTPELGVRPIAARDVAPTVLPLSRARFAIENDVVEDLDAEWAEAVPQLADVREAGRRMAALGLLPSVVRLDEVLGPADLKLLRAVYGLQQVSYGNASVREPSGGFWMTGRGVDKSRLEVVGRDVVLVTGVDRARGAVRMRVPPGCGDARASVDAIEHALLYEAFPRIGAIVHVHAWIDGVDATLQNWPCGTVELAEEVLALVSRQRDPAAAEVGLRNHGLTLTGPDPASIFARVQDRLRRDVPPS